MNETIERRAEEMVPTLRARTEEIEAGRRVPADLSDRLGGAGFYRLLVPSALGGGEMHPAAYVRALTTLATGDSAAAWTVMTGSTTGLLLAYLDPDFARQILDEAPNAALAGVFAPTGKATPENGGYRLKGSWQWGSGCENAKWRMGGGLVFDEDGPRMVATGVHEIRSFFFRADESTMVDTWHVSGMRGTGSHDLVVDDVFVPERQTTCILVDRPHYDGPLYRFPLFGLLAMGVAAVGMGIARAALDHIEELARTKRSRGGKKTMAESELVQVRLASAEAELRAAQALMTETLDEVYGYAEKGDALTPMHKARLRLAATFAAQASARSVDTAYNLGGGGSVFDTSPLQRYLRDVHVMTQHVMVGETTLKPVGRILLGLDADISLL